MDINTSTYLLPTTAVGAAFPGACSAGTDVFGAGHQSALSHTPVLAAVRPEPRLAALRPAPAKAMLLAPMAAELATGMSTVKQTTNVNETRIDAGGYGASGPHPEREPGLI